VDLLLVRHALPERVVRDDGLPADPALSELGHLQAALVAEWLADEPVTSLVTSPLRRARQTAEPIAARLGLEPVVVDDVAEMDAAASAYIPTEELTREEIQATLAEWADESFLAPFQARVVTAVREIVAANPGSTVAVVCHGGVINALVGWILGLERFMVFDVTYTSVTRIRTNGRIWTVRSMGEAGHLRRLSHP
jgi:2,3-bisphosphoglycerate-dependent phosphoglycerate mutase